MKRTPYLALAALGLIGSLAVLRATAGEVGLAPDSYVYLATARGLAAGRGLTLPAGPDHFVHSSHFPPLYPGLLALSGLGLADTLVSGRWLNAFLFGVNVFLVGFTIFRLSTSSRAAVLGALIALGSETLLLVHAHLWSEPSFYTFALLGLWLLAEYLRAPGSRRWLVPALAFALASLVRYAGLTLALAGALSLFLASDRPWPQRLPRSFAFLAASTGPVGLWMLNNLRLAGTLANRGITFHPVEPVELRLGLETVSTWVLPESLVEGLTLGRLSLAFTLLLALAILVARALGASTARDAPWLPYLLFTVLYPLFLLVSISFFDDQTSLDARILSPAYLSMLILAAVLLVRRLSGASASLRALVGMLIVALALAGLYAGWGRMSALARGEGKGYSSPPWSGSRLVEQVRGYPEGTPVYSNGHDLLYLLSGRPALPLPQEISPNTLRGNPDFEAEVAQMARVLREGEGVLVYFDDLKERREYLPTEEELLDLLPLRRLTRWQGEGSLYRLDP